MLAVGIINSYQHELLQCLGRQVVFHAVGMHENSVMNISLHEYYQLQLIVISAVTETMPNLSAAQFITLNTLHRPGVIPIPETLRLES